MFDTLSSSIYWLSLIVLVHTYVLYPAIIALAAKLRPARANTLVEQETWPSVSIVMSAFNEQNNIQAKLDNCLALDYPRDKLEIIIASDGSSDDTVAIAEKMATQHPFIKVLDNSGQKGKAYRINQAVSSARSEMLVFFDLRQSVSEQALKNLVRHFQNPDIGAVTGELQFLDSEGKPSPLGAYWKYETFIRQNEAIFDSCIGVTGAIYAMRRHYFSPFSAETILDDVIVPMNAAIKHRSRVVYEKDAIAYDVPPTDLEKEQRRKTRTIAGNFQLLKLAPYLLNPFKNRLVFQFVSHKLLRLLGPWLIIAHLLSNFALAGDNWYYSFMFTTIVAVLGLYALSKKVPNKLSDSGLMKLVDAFFLLNYYAALGLIEYLTNDNIHTWKKN